MRKLSLLSISILAVTSELIFATLQPAYALVWTWSYFGTGINANGTFTTNDTGSIGILSNSRHYGHKKRF